MKTRILLGASCAALLLSLAAHANGDVVVNGSFTTDLSGWTPTTGSGGTVTLDALDGAPAAGSVRLTSPDSTAVAFLIQCIDFTPTGPVDFKGSAFTESVAGGAVGILRLVPYDAVGCGGNVLGNFNGSVIGSEPGTNGTWTVYGFLGATISTSTQSVGISVRNFANTPGDSIDILWDHIQFGPSGTLPVELESFTVE